MMHYKKMLLTLTLVMGWLPVIHAAQLNTHGLLEDSQLDLTLRNIWLVNTSDQLSEYGIGEQRAWAQGIHLDYRSGWFNDAFGLDASWYGVAKLYANKVFWGRNLLRNNNGHAEGFNKVGQLYAKARWGDKQRYAHLYLGWRQLNKFGTLDGSNNRAAPGSWEGFSFDTNWESFTARGALVRRMSARDEPEKRHFSTLKSLKRIDYITTGEINWSPSRGNKFSYVVGESKDYLLRHGLIANATIPMSDSSAVLLSASGYYSDGLRNWEGTQGFTKHASHVFAMASYQYKNALSGIGWSKTKAHLNNGLGKYYWHFGKNTRGYFNSKADGIAQDYINDGEQMLYLYSQLQFNKQVSAGVYGNYGYDVKWQGVSLHEWEYGAFVLWKPDRFPGLNIFTGFGPAYGWKLVKDNPYLTADKRNFHRSKGVGGAIDIEYRFNLLNRSGK